MATYHKDRSLHYLKELDDYKVHEDDTDVRDWDIYTANGEEFGEVENLIVDVRAKRVRYLVVELEDELFGKRDQGFWDNVAEEIRDFFGREEDRYVIIPIGMVSIDKDDKRVIMHGMDSLGVASGPRYSYDPEGFFDPNFEVATVRYYTDNDDEFKDYYTRNAYRPVTDGPIDGINDGTFYESGLFEDDYYRRTRYAD